MSELKPCPFCGKMPKVEPNGDCYCDYYICPMAPDSYMPKDWNTRPIEDALRARIAELEAEHEKVFDLVRKLRMYCIWAKWDNPDTEYEFNEFDEEVCKWLSKFMEREA